MEYTREMLVDLSKKKPSLMDNYRYDMNPDKEVQYKRENAGLLKLKKIIINQQLEI